MEKIVIIGGGGHAKSVISSIQSMEKYEIIGIVDSDTNLKNLLGYKVIGDDSCLKTIYRNNVRFAHIAMGQFSSLHIKEKIYNLLLTIGFDLPNIIDGSAVLGTDLKLGKGIFIGKNAVVNTSASVGNMAIINTGAIVEHDCAVGDYSHIAPNATLCGGVFVGEKTHIGAGSVVIQNLKIGSGSMIGAGSVVVKNVPNRCKAFGNPCEVK